MTFKKHLCAEDKMKLLGGGFKDFVCSPLVGEMIQFDYIIFLTWVGSTTNYLS